MTPSRLYFKHFSLVELLIVIAILAILISLLSPSLRKGLETAQQMACMKNMKKNGEGFTMHAEDNDGYLPYARWNFNSSSPSDALKTSWDFAIWEYLKAEPIEKQDWNHIFSEDERLESLKCPGSEIPDYLEYNVLGVTAKRPTASYVMPARHALDGYSGIFSNSHLSQPQRVNLFSIETADTILLTELDLEQTNWYYSYQGYGNAVTMFENLININSVGSNVWPWQTDPFATNNNIFLHGNGKINFLFFDGRAQLYEPDDPELIGEGTVPEFGHYGYPVTKGAWTTAAGD